MQFRLFYEGPLRPANTRTGVGGADRLADHKHSIRRAFHRQLKHYWETHPFLRDVTTDGTVLGQPRKLLPQTKLSKAAALLHPKLNGFSFVPLVCEEFHLLCRVDLLMLRRDKPGNVLQASDLDNRLKVVFDALKMPTKPGELGDNTPQEGEDPLYVLVQEDSLISHVSVETDELLDPPIESEKDDRYVRLLVKVTITPYYLNMFNIGFGAPSV